MPRNPSTGVYSKPAGTTAVTGTVIDPVPWNNLTTDLGNEITNSLPRDGSAPMIAPLKNADGTQALPSITFASDITTGIYRKAAGTGAFISGGAEIANWSGTGMAITGTFSVSGAATFSGNVSFGTMSGEAMRGTDYGLTLSNNAVDAVNDIDIAVGNVASDGATPFVMQLASSITKRLDANWAVGTNQGGLDTGAIANNTYHVWLIQRSDTGVVDALFSLSATSPTMPTNYDRKRRIGSIVRASAAILPFHQSGAGRIREYTWDTPIVDVNSIASQGTSAVIRTLTLPTGIAINSIATYGIASNPGAGDNLYVSALTMADIAVSAINIGQISTISGGRAQATLEIMTNTSAQVRTRQAGGGSQEFLSITTRGWIDYL